VFKLQKFKQNEIRGLEKTLRGAGTDNLYCVYGNNLAEYEGDSYLLDVAEKRIKSVFSARNVRRDAVYLVDVLITADKDFFDGSENDKTEQFFNDCFSVLCSFFGASNVVSAVVDMRRNPCMHFCFVPITSVGGLSAKEILNRKALISLKKTLQEGVFDKYGLREDAKSELISIRNENDQIRNEKTELEEEKRCLMVALEDFKGGKDVLKRIKEIRLENDTLRGENIDLMFELSDLRDENKKLLEKIDNLEMQKSQTDVSNNQLETENISQFPQKPWSVGMMYETTLLRHAYDFLLREYVGGSAGINDLPDSIDKRRLLELEKYYKMRGL
jgi:hypothetical protein